MSKNIILLGVIPGPREPERHINSFVERSLRKREEEIQFSFASIGFLYDLPDARKFCGLLSFNARRGI